MKTTVERKDSSLNQPRTGLALTLSTIIALGLGASGVLIGVWNGMFIAPQKNDGSPTTTTQTEVHYWIKYTTITIPVSGAQAFTSISLEKPTQIDLLVAKLSGSDATVDFNFNVSMNGIWGMLDPIFWTQAMTAGGLYMSNAVIPAPRTLPNGTGYSFNLVVHVASGTGSTNYTVFLAYTTFE